MLSVVCQSFRMASLGFSANFSSVYQKAYCSTSSAPCFDCGRKEKRPLLAD